MKDQLYEQINVVYCVSEVEIQIEISKGWCTADTDSKVSRFERWPIVREKQKINLKNRVNLYKSDNHVAENRPIMWEKQ